jgi:hypothetical protein
MGACQDALVLSTQLGFRSVQGEAWDSLGYAHHRLPGNS